MYIYLGLYLLFLQAPENYDYFKIMIISGESLDVPQSQIQNYGDRKAKNLNEYEWEVLVTGTVGSKGRTNISKITK